MLNLPEKMLNHEICARFNHNDVLLPHGIWMAWESQVSPEFSWYGKHHAARVFGTFKYTISGEGALVYKDREYRITPGTAMMFETPEDFHYYLPSDCKKWEYIHISFNGTIPLSLFRNIIDMLGPVITVRPDSSVMLAMMNIYHAINNHKIIDAEDGTTQLLQFLMEIHRIARPLAESNQEWVNASIQFVIENFAEEITVDDMVNKSGMSRGYFCRMFHQLTGITPVNFITQIRLQHACRLLLDTALPVYDIAVRSGFSDGNYFSRVFNKNFKMTPGRYRVNPNLAQKPTAVSESLILKSNVEFCVKETM